MRARYYSPNMRRFINADIIHGTISDSTSLNRYSYVNGNPVSFVDPFGLSAERGITPTALEAAYLASHIYDATEKMINKTLDEKYGGWRLQEIIDPGFSEIGLKIGIYKKTMNNSVGYCVVYAGTNMDFKEDEEGESWFINLIDAASDWSNNISQPIGLSIDMMAAIYYAKEFVDQNRRAKITFIGHSKGGAEAATAAVYTNQDAILFNPATSSLCAYGVTSTDYSADMMVYVVRGEVLNELLGPISMPIDGFEYLELYDPGVGTFGKHSIKSVIKALEGEE